MTRRRIFFPCKYLFIFVLVLLFGTFAYALTPEIYSIEPDNGTNTSPTDVTIYGANFEATPRVELNGGGPSIVGSVDIDAVDVYVSGNYAYVAVYESGLQVLRTFDPCTNIAFVDSTTLTATVPAGLPEGTHNLHVVNPNGERDILHNAFNVLPSFHDVPPGFWAEDAIYKIYEAGITTGCCKDPLKFCPENPVNRDQMAVFLGRATHGSNFTPPDATGIFADVPKCYWAADWIEQFYADGLTKGCKIDPHDPQAPTMYYCPEYPVTRTTMAIFLLRAKHGANYQPPPATGIFEDVGVNHWAADWIEQIYREGITKGCRRNPLMYCPSNHVTRAQMAVFLTRMLGLTLKDGLVGHWKFDNPSDLGHDSSGHKNHGTVTSTDVTYFDNGKINGAAKFTEGTIDAAIKIPHSDSLNLTDQITTAAWVNLDGVSTDNGDAIFSKDGSLRIPIHSGRRFRLMSATDSD